MTITSGLSTGSLYGVSFMRNNERGLLQVVLDESENHTYTMDLYSNQPQCGALLFESAVPNGTHTVMLTLLNSTTFLESDPAMHITGITYVVF